MAIFKTAQRQLQKVQGKVTTEAPSTPTHEGWIIGEIVLFAGNYAPRGWAACDGTMLDINSNQALYSILGTQYGGDGRTNFQLPHLAPLTEVDGGTMPIRYIICLEGVYPARA